MTSIRTSAAIVLLLTVCACKVGPNYKRPATTVPDQYRGLAPDASQQASAQPFADMQWAAVYQDEVLQGLIKEALTNNYDLKQAVARVAQVHPAQRQLARQRRSAGRDHAQAARVVPLQDLRIERDDPLSLAIGHENHPVG